MVRAGNGEKRPWGVSPGSSEPSCQASLLAVRTQGAWHSVGLRFGMGCCCDPESRHYTEGKIMPSGSQWAAPDGHGSSSSWGQPVSAGQSVIHTRRAADTWGPERLVQWKS